MNDTHHHWAVGSPLPFIRPHSRAKHRVLSNYLSRYVETLTQNVSIPQFALTLVDGFSGGGLYVDESTGEIVEGSPFLMIRAMQEARVKAQSRRSKSFNLDVEYYFVEKSPHVHDFLKQSLDKHELSLGPADHVAPLLGSFADHSQKILQRIKKRARGERAIFLLDQFGYSEVPLAQIRTILHSVRNAEVILTFATDSLIDYMSGSEGTQQILEKIGLSLQATSIPEIKQYGNWRWAIQAILHQDLRIGTGAEFFTPFFIRSSDAHRDYWLIHLSNHAIARDVMTQIHWQENTSFAHYGHSGLRMLGYDPKEDVNITRQKALPAFYFDDTAQAATHLALLQQLPERLKTVSDGIKFGEFFAQITNETPATREIINFALEELNRQRIISITDKTGSTKRKLGAQSPNDIIIPSKQRLFFFGE